MARQCARASPRASELIGLPARNPTVTVTVIVTGIVTIIVTVRS
jgi:hypothetical protein